MRRLLLGLVVATALFGGAITPELARILQSTADGDRIAVILTTSEQCNLTAMTRASTDEKISSLKAVAEHAQARLLDGLRAMGAENVRTHWLVSRISFRATAGVIRALLSSDDIASINPDLPVRLSSKPLSPCLKPPTDAYQWNINMVRAEPCWWEGYSGVGVVLGSIGTGVEATHVAFHGRWRQTNGWHDAVNQRTSPYDDVGTGTAELGLACGGTTQGQMYDMGIAPGASFITAKAFDASQQSSYSLLDECFDWMAGTGRPNVLLLGWSWGTRTDAYFWSTIQNLRGLGIVVVGTATVSETGETFPPGSFPIVLGTGACDVDADVTGFSGHGPAPNQSPWSDPSYWPRPDWYLINPAVLAPGEMLMTCIPGGDYTYDAWGTDMAAAHVAGCAAILLQKHPGLTPDQVFNIITEYAAKPSSHGPYPNNNYGWGILDCKSALDALPSEHELSVSPLATFPVQARHLVRRPGSSELHAVYVMDGMVYYLRSTDDGATWPVWEQLGRGATPSISLDYNNRPWVSYVRDGASFKARARRADGTWKPEMDIWSQPGYTIGEASMVCSNWRPDYVPYPPDMAYAVFVVNSEQDLPSHGLVCVAFDTVADLQHAYRWIQMTVDDINAGLDSLPCIARTPGDSLHVVWQQGPRDGPRVIRYKTCGTDPSRIRRLVNPVWTPVFTVSDPGHYLASSPFVEAWSDSVIVSYSDTRAYPDGIADVWRRAKSVNNFYYVWASLPLNRSESPEQPSDWSSVSTRRVCAWREVTGDGFSVYGRFEGDAAPHVLYSSSGQRSIYYPHQSAKIATQDIVHLLFTEYVAPSIYSVRYIKYTHNSRLAGEGDSLPFYSVTVGESVPSPYCVARDGIKIFPNYRIDYADDELRYGLGYLDPGYSYFLRAVFYHESDKRITQEVSINGREVSVATIAPHCPETLWCEIPADLRRDTRVLLALTRHTGDYAILSELTVFQSEGSSGSGGGQGTPRPLAADLELRPPRASGSFFEIEYSLETRAHFSLSIFDVTGREVAVLHRMSSGPEDPGLHTICWDGTGLCSGTYFCRLSVGSRQVCRKLVLVQ